MTENLDNKEKKRGRPKKLIVSKVSVTEDLYTKSHAEKLLELLSRGATNAQCMAGLSIKHDTFYRWAREEKDFKAAYEIGRPKAESYWVTKLQEMVERGDDKGCKACIMILNNNFGWGQNELSAKANINNKFTQINVSGSMNVLDTKSIPELIETIKDNFKDLQQKNVIPAEYTLIAPEESNDE